MKIVMDENVFKKLLSIVVTCMVGWVCTYLAVHVFSGYALGLFIWLPTVMGAISTILYGYNNKLTRTQLILNAQLTLLVFCLGLLIFAWEGLICLIMAAPIGVFFTWVGFLIGRLYLQRRIKPGTPASVILLILSVPSLMAFEHSVPQTDDLRSVVTSIEINASPEKVWQNVVKFPELTAPTELVFKTGIAYPINATIDGRGVGAIRHCNFSTGSFIEPITVWNEPNLLRFSVSDQPETMKELSFYDIHPNHLHGYWVSKQGQFRLTSLPGGRTLLEGTTWYVNKIRPGFYWSAWSDYIVHEIHQRVLAHIKTQSEL